MDVFGDQMYLQSSDMSYACQYKLADPQAFLELLERYSRDPADIVTNPATGKPVIYLYPTERQEVTVRLDFDGQLIYTYPAYNGGWQMIAEPDGTLYNTAGGSTHYYLFWEGNSNKTDWDFSEGFVVKGGDVEAFLREKLSYMGLTPREYNDFIVFWVPQLSQNAYNLITFSHEEFDEIAHLTITPQPDSILRIQMIFKAIDAPIDIPEQQLEPFEHTGFTVVEWGGTRA